MSSILPSQLTPEELQLLSNYPALQPPAGVTPNFKDAPNHGKVQIIPTSLLLCIATIFVLNRVYMKTCIVRKYTWDDLTLSVAMTGAVAHYAASTYGVCNGRIGVHEWNVNIPQAASSHFLIPTYLVTILIPFTFLFLKLTFFIVYRHVFGPMRWMRISANLGAVFTTLFYVIMIVCALLYATHRRGKPWFSHVNTRFEKLADDLSVPQSSVNLAFDLYILILPIAAVTKLQMATRRRIGIIFILSTGLLACAGSILSIVYRAQIQRTNDKFWAFASVNTVTLVEMFVGIICACMPAAAHTCRHHLASYDSVKNKARLGNEILLLGHHKTNTASSPFLERGNRDAKSSSDGRVDLGALEYPMPVLAKPPQIVIRGGGPEDLNYEPIHLTWSSP